MEEDMKVLEEITIDDLLNCWEGGEKEYQAIKNLIKAYKEDEAVIEEMANEIFIEHNPHFKTDQEVIEYFRNKVKEKKE